MSDILEQQAEEREALQSIYEGDENFKEIDKITYQYKYGEENTPKSFLVEVKWRENYPNEMPDINLDAFYNRHIVPSVKETIVSALKDEAENWLGCGMTFTLFESIKDRIDALTSNQPEKITAPINPSEIENQMSAVKISENPDEKRKEPKKEQLSKAQKRRQWERTDYKGERARGWNWVDIVKHLSQTGGKHEQDTSQYSSCTPGTSNDATYTLQPLNG